MTAQPASIAIDKSSPRRAAAPGFFLAGVHALLAGAFALPPVAAAAFSPTGEFVGGALGWILSLMLLAGGAISCAMAWRAAARPRVLAIASAFLLALYAALFLVLDVLVGLMAPVNLSGRLDVPNAQIYGWALEPNQRLTIVNPDTKESRVESVNSFGWRDVEHVREKTRPRVLLLGDSQVFGVGLWLEQTIGRQLEAELGGEYEVIQMGLGGYGTDQQYLVLINEGLSWNPDHVVVVFTPGNDVMDNMHETSFMGTAPKPSFHLQDGKLVQRPFEGMRASLLRRLFGRSNIARLVRFKLQSANITENPQGLRVLRGEDGENYSVLAEDQGELEDFDNDYSPYAVFKKELSPKLKEGWDITFALLEAMRDASHRNGAQFSIYMNFQFPDDYTFEIESAGTMQVLEARTAFDRIRGFAREKEIPFIEEPEEMIQLNISGENSFATDGHYGAQGAARAARILAEHICALDGSATP